METGIKNILAQHNPKLNNLCIKLIDSKDENRFYYYELVKMMEYLLEKSDIIGFKTCKGIMNLKKINDELFKLLWNEVRSYCEGNSSIDMIKKRINKANSYKLKMKSRSKIIKKKQDILDKLTYKIDWTNENRTMSRFMELIYDDISKQLFEHVVDSKTLSKKLFNEVIEGKTPLKTKVMIIKKLVN